VEDMTGSESSPSSSVPRDYRSLYKYLDNRFADTVVLTFEQIESLLGFALPDLARLRQEWWASAAAGDVASSQSLSWAEASRSATPNLSAQSVVFERLAS
jgi:hypothetical protein